MTKKVAIIGGGASGLLCALLCAKAKCKVDIYEQNSKVGKKILVSGNGRCNITNQNISIDDYFSENRIFVNSALKEFGFNEFKKFIESLGILLDIKKDGRCYPLSNEAKSVVSILTNSALNSGVNIHTNTKIAVAKELFNTHDKVVIATGSQAAQHLGGCSDGLEFAKEFGHNIIPTYPSLVQLELESKLAPKMAGSKIDAEVTLLLNKQKDISIKGDVLFTSYGVSGFAILDISQRASAALMNYEAVDISINLLPNMNTQQLSSHIINLSNSIPKFSITDILHGLLPIKIVNGVLESLEISKSLSSKDINTKLSKKIANQISNWRFEVKDTHGFRHGEVSGGGVNTLEINPKTMESLKQKNLYFCGEVLDVLGRRGGYNFAWAWASAYACAKEITSSI